ncbi:MAG TPA: DNA polymerase III subunit alpha [Longimicrobiales bacterium]|nr:DNA polymerase III subunit alpha [Longimicrobiales bacterium]
MYIELRARSAFSFGDGACAPESLARAAAEMGYPSLGLTDHADLGGAIRFALGCREVGIRPVVGAELVVDGHPLAVIAKTAVGFRNMAALVTRSRMGDWQAWAAEKDALVARYGEALHTDRDGRVRTRATAVTPRRKVDVPHPLGRALAQSPSRSARGVGGARSNALGRDREVPGREGSPARGARGGGEVPPRGQPALNLHDLEDRTTGLHLLTGGPGGELASLVRAGRSEEAMFLLARLRELFPDGLSVEVQLHHVSGEESALAGALIELAERQRVPWVVANDPRYLDAGSRLVHELLTANRAGLDIDTAASWGVLHPNGEWRLKSPAEMAVLWKGREAGLEEAARVASDAAFDLRWLRPPLPTSHVPAGESDASWLRELTFRGAAVRWGQVDDRQRAQLEHEIGVITRLGFAGFFLVMHDAVTYARGRGILCQGRGSAANSAVAFCLGITAVDPVRHGLLFERFLSEVRTDGLTEAPDIDVDFEMHRREEVLDYMYRRYGRAHAAITAVTQMYHAPTAIQDCMRALGWPAQTAFNLSKRVHHLEPAAGADELEAGLAARFGVDLARPKGRALLAALRSLDDVPRLRSTHPGGFVLCAEPLGEFMPIEETTMGRTILQFDKDDLDAAGVPKFDFLGLGGLTVIHTAFDSIRARTGRELKLYDLPVDDPKTYEMIGRGETLGTFQIESRAQIQSILQTRPTRLYDIVVQVALIRPGPIQARFVRPYTRRRLGLEEVEYADPRMEPILRRTYGIPIFQEQAMALSMALGGFSAAEADELRRAMGHQRKLPKLHAALQRLADRMAQNGVAPGTAASIVEDLHSFANYGFPESHAWSFALIAYATAYLKAHYPADFLTALLNAWPMGFYPPATLVHEARRNGVVVLPPCLRDGEWECTLVDQRGLPPRHPELGAPAFAGASSGQPEEAFRTPHLSGRGDPAFAADSGHQPVEGSSSSHRSARGSPQSPSPTPGKPAVAEEKAVYPIERTPAKSAAHAQEGDLRNRERRERNAPKEEGDGENRDVAVRVGWKHIKGLGEQARDALQRAAEQGAFTGVEDVVRRAGLSRRDALHLARAGALEAFEPGRRRAAWEALRAAGDTLPLAPARHLPFEPAEMSDEELVFLDYLATGISAAGHPMEYIRPRLREYGVAGARDLADLPDRVPVLVAGLVVARQHPATARGTVFILLEDEHGFINVIVPPAVYDAHREVIHHSPFLLIQGRFEREDRVLNVIAERFRELRRSPSKSKSMSKSKSKSMSMSKSPEGAP